MVPLAVVGCGTLERVGVAKGAREVDFETEIRPVLEVQCLQCHNSETSREFAGLNLETRELALTTGRSAPVIRPGDPAGSLLLKVLALEVDHPVAMPPSPDKLRKEEQEAFRDWIAGGAKWPEGEAGKLRMPD